MEFVKLKSNKGEFLDGLIHIIPDVFNDDRGYFLESWNSKKINEYLGKELIFTQDNISKSKKNVIRGLHYQMNPSPQEKLIRCLSGSIFDVAVDIRKNSKTFGQWAGLEISEKNKFQLLVPEGFAHGFLSLAEDSILYYKVSNLWDKKLEKTLKWDDQNINIRWPLSTNSPLISTKDKSGFSLQEAIELKYIFF